MILFNDISQQYYSRYMSTALVNIDIKNDMNHIINP